MVDILVLYVILGFLFAVLVGLLFYVLRFLSRREEITNARYETLIAQSQMREAALRLRNEHLLAQLGELVKQIAHISTTLRGMELRGERLEGIILAQGGRGAASNTLSVNTHNANQARREGGIEIKDSSVSADGDLIDGKKQIGRDEQRGG